MANLKPIGRWDALDWVGTVTLGFAVVGVGAVGYWIFRAFKPRPSPGISGCSPKRRRHRR